MPAASASPIPAGLGQLTGPDPARSDELPGLLDRLRRLPGPRRLRSGRHPLSYVLVLAACGVLAGAKPLTAIAEWAADAPDRLLLHCGATLRDPDRLYRAPSEATVRRVLQRIDGDALDAAIGGWLTARAAARTGQDEHPPSRPVRAAVAVDGKLLRGAIRAGRRVRLISALRGDGIVLAQREVDAKSNGTWSFGCALRHGVPQLLKFGCLERAGAGLAMTPAQADGPAVRAALVRLLGDATLRANARRLGEERLAMPSPNELAHTLGDVVAAHRAGPAPALR